MLFADFVVLCTDTQEEAEQRWREAMEIRGIRVSRQKTEHLIVKGNEEEDMGRELKIQNEKLNRVEVFKYVDQPCRPMEELKKNTSRMGCVEEDHKGDVRQEGPNQAERENV
jgi:hypothetical protein